MLNLLGQRSRHENVYHNTVSVVESDVSLA